ncbi:protein of unknown function [Pricia antarctica]|uniref:DUF4861 domain-containing protein n=1 Tax=Pricia antarctica TaxID=641691 RepID=A0A1G7C0L6_9FLAO|nr:DUF4861 domain-containing protein [Pricia antarctica]SDE32819.1 protein of unknown function [Pricia antarctica]
MNSKQLAFICLTGLFFMGCAEKEAPVRKKIVVSNTMDTNREFETVSIPIDSLDIDATDDKKGRIVIIDDATQKPILSQTIDSDGDGTDDMVLFQPEIKATSEMVFSVSSSDSTAATANDSVTRCYSRFVPERTDDYAWENDRVAFRTYGPTAQKMVEDDVKGGTLSSGIDAWLKRVDYPIINKWYKKELETDGSYHEDDGEGLDSFHVGSSRGVGGIASKDGDTYSISKNFTAWKRLYNGPIRTSFILTYADWDAAGKQISEEKHISLDYGSNLSKFEISIKGTDTISAGLALHENEGTIGVGGEEGWISYWEPHFDSEIGTGIVVPNGHMLGHEKYETEETDRSNLYAHIKLNEDGKAVYYAGFGWKKSAQFMNRTEWENYLEAFSEKLKNPLVVEMR